MAEKILQTRIQLKYDTYANWEASTFILKEGEVAICTVPTGTDSAPSNSLPALLMKVGDGLHKFSELPWLQAQAADVYNWAKAANKPTYSANEITNLETYINNTIQDTDTQYTIVKGSNDYTWTLMSKAKDATEYTTTVATFTIPDVSDRVAALEEKVGDLNVEGQIENAIAELDAAAVTAGTGQVIGSVSQEDGVVTATLKTLQEADIPTVGITKVNGLQDALDAKQDVVAFEGAYDKDNNKAATMADVTNAVAGLAGAVHFIGVKDSLPDTANNGDICIVGNKEYVYSTSDNGWHELGDETIYAVKGEIKDTDIAADAAIAQSKIAGLGDALNAKLDVTVAASTYETKDDAAAKLTEAKDYTDDAIKALDVTTVTAGTGEVISAVGEVDGKVSVTKKTLTADDIPTLAIAKVSGLQAALDAKANDADLAAIAKTGNVNDLIQTAGDVLVFQCGSASVNV